MEYDKYNIKEKRIKAIDNNRLKLIEGEQNWYNYVLSITELIWARNLYDGYQIHIYTKNKEEYLATFYV